MTQVRPATGHSAPSLLCIERTAWLQAKDIVIQGHPDADLNGSYKYDSTHNGWPLCANDKGMFMYRFAPKRVFMVKRFEQYKEANWSVDGVESKKRRPETQRQCRGTPPYSSPTESYGSVAMLDRKSGWTQ